MTPDRRETREERAARQVPSTWTAMAREIQRLSDEADRQRLDPRTARNECRTLRELDRTARALAICILEGAN